MNQGDSVRSVEELAAHHASDKVRKPPIPSNLPMLRAGYHLLRLSRAIAAHACANSNI